MKVLVTGGTGFIGKKLVHLLHDRNHSVRILSRSGQGAQKQFPFPVEGMAWNANGMELPPAALEGIDAVIHLAGEGIADKRWSEERKKKILDSRVIGTRKVVEAINRASTKPKVFLGASAIGFYGDRGDETLTESSSPGDGFLSVVCQEWEKASDALSDSVRKCTVRVGIVLGEGGGALKPLLPLFRLGLGGRVASGNQWMSWIHIDDLVGLFVHLMENDALQGVFNGTTPRPVTNKDFTKALSTAVRRPALFPAPAIALKVAMGELAVLVLASQRVSPEKTLLSHFQYRFDSLLPALEQIVKKKAVTPSLSHASS